MSVRQYPQSNRTTAGMETAASACTARVVRTESNRTTAGMETEYYRQTAARLSENLIEPPLEWKPLKAKALLPGTL